MKGRAARLTLLAAVIGLLALLAMAMFSKPGSPVALLRVVDATGKPISGAVIRAEGLRTKPGPYSSGWYGWQADRVGVFNVPVATDNEGYARVPYPKYVFERIETGTICLSVDHPDFVADRPERMVTFAPPARAPWRVWVDYALDRVRHKQAVVRPNPIVLQKGAILKLKVGSDGLKDAPLFAQVSGMYKEETNFWLRPAAGELVTRKLSAGHGMVRAIQFDTKGTAWFGPTTNLDTTIGQVTGIEVNLRPGITIHGRLDETVPRPVRDGRVIANVLPPNEKAQNWPPDWHAWSSVREDGTFELGSMPEGQLEIVALCDGYVSTNGQGQSSIFHYPQAYTIGTNNLNITITMEATCSLEVKVADDRGNALKDAVVATWPNTRYGDWSATILGADCYNTADFVRDPGQREAYSKWWVNRPPSFQATSDVAGVALVLNLPKEVTEFSVEHPRLALPAKEDNTGQKRRQSSVALQSGHTNRVSVQLEPSNKAPIAHY